MVATRSAVLLAKIEATYRVDPVPTPGANALLILEPPNVSAEAQRIQRNPARSSLSPFPGRTGRITQSIEFMHEVMGSGSLTAASPPPMDALLRACGLARTDFATAGLVQQWKRPGNVGVATWVNGSTSAFTPNYVRYYKWTATTGGGSGVAAGTVTSPAMDLPDGSTLASITTPSVVLTNGTEIVLGNGAKVTPSAVSGIAIGDSFVFQFAPAGSLYKPVSTGFESVTTYTYYEGLLHKMTGARGSVSLECVAGEIPKFSFNMTGDWILPVDASIPTDAVLPDREPPIVEFANVRIDNNLAACPANFSVDLANETSINECANGSQGYAGGTITGRTPTVSFDADFGPEATYPFWNRFQNATEVDFSFNVGTVRGNMMHCLAHIQFTQNAYGDRNSSRIYDISAEAVSRAGDDEVSFYFY
jgi:hypothetical protein